MTAHDWADDAGPMPHANFKAGRLDVSARAGVLLGAHASGTSYQPNLLSRASRDQALIAGVAASTAFAVGTATHSFLRSMADRLPRATGSTAGRVTSGLIVDGAAALAGLVAGCRAEADGRRTDRSVAGPAGRHHHRRHGHRRGRLGPDRVRRDAARWPAALTGRDARYLGRVLRAHPPREGPRRLVVR